MLISVVACSKKPSSDNNTKFPDNITGTWSRSVIDTSKSSDTATDKNTGQKWVKDIVVLTGNEAAKLQNLIQAVPQQTRNVFATTFKKFMNMLEKFASHSTSLYIKIRKSIKNFIVFLLLIKTMPSL